MATHLDGARLWNAAVASKLSERELARGFDSISVVSRRASAHRSAPLVAGSRDVIRRCHRYRRCTARHAPGRHLAAAGCTPSSITGRGSTKITQTRAPRRGLVGTKGLAIDLDPSRTNLVMNEPERTTPA